jgi:chaperonin GroEL
MSASKLVHVQTPNTIIIDGAGEGKSIEARFKAIRAQIEEANRRKPATTIAKSFKSV